MTFYRNFWFSNGWFQSDVTFETDRCNHIDPPPPNVECHIISQWDMSREKKMSQTLQNHAYIRHLVQELMKWYFQSSVGHTFCLLFINQGLINKLRSASQACQFILVNAKNSLSLCIYVHLLPHCISLSVNWVTFVFLVFYKSLQYLFCFRECFPC